MSSTCSGSVGVLVWGVYRGVTLASRPWAVSGAYRLGSRPWPGCGCVSCARPWPEMTRHLLKQFVGCLVCCSYGSSTLRCNVNWSNLKGEKVVNISQLLLAKDKLEDTDASQYSVKINLRTLSKSYKLSNFIQIIQNYPTPTANNLSKIIF